MIITIVPKLAVIKEKPRSRADNEVNRNFLTTVSNREAHDTGNHTVQS